MSKFHVGDRVRTDERTGTVIDVDRLAGRVVMECDSGCGGITVLQFPGKKVLWLHEQDFELITPTRYELHITCLDGKTTNAVYKVNGEITQRKQAKCSPSDTFNFEDGARTAFCRVFPPLYEPFAPLHKSQTAQAEKADMAFKVGDKVIATDNANYRKNAVATIDGVDPFDKITSYRVVFDDDRYKLKLWCHTDSVKPYTEPATPEPTLFITRAMLTKLGACSGGLAEFDSKFPSGKGEFEEVKKATNLSNRYWLLDNKDKIAAMQDEKETVRLYCVKNKTDVGIRDYSRYLTVGKIYEFDGNYIKYDTITSSKFADFEDWKKGDFGLASCLIPLVRRPAKVNEYVRICQSGDWLGTNYSVGDIFKITSLSESNPNRCYCNRGTDEELFFDVCEYEVLDGYKPEEKVEEYYNGKVVCVSDGNMFHTKGKVYEVVNGIISDDTKLGKYNPAEPKKTLEEINEIYVPKFIEYKGEAK